MNNPKQQGALVAYVFDNRPPQRRGRRVNTPPMFRIGQRVPTGTAPHGGGGPENAGVKNDKQALKMSPAEMQQQQPSWRLFEDDYFGPAAASKTPVTAGGGHPSNPSNNFRALGDNFGGRQ
jgi:hypothetical protein